MEYNVITDLPEEDYHELPQIGSTTIKDMSVSPAYYHQQQISRKEKGVTDAMVIGSMFHQLILEPDTDLRFQSASAKIKKRGSKAWDKEAAATDKTMMKLSDFENTKAMADAFKKTNAYKLMFQGELSTEVSVIGPDKKCRFDLLKKKQNHYVAYDLKTTDEIPQDEKAWARYFLKWGYHIQDAWYRSVAEEAGLYIKHFFFPVVSKKPPYDHAIVHLNQDFLDYGKIEAESAYARYLSCKRDNDWPGKYEMSGEKSLTIELPGWVK